MDIRIMKVLKKIETDPSQSISDLAGMVGLSRSRLTHLFKAETGLSLAELLDTKRMDRAADLLRSTHMRIKEITYMTGFQHPASFSRAFLRKHRCTPGNFRRQSNGRGTA